MPALSIISYAINYLRESLVHVLCNRINSFLEDDIFWIITLPAIWSDAAKQFMKEAAVKVREITQFIVIKIIRQTSLPFICKI